MAQLNQAAWWKNGMSSLKRVAGKGVVNMAFDIS